MIPLEKVFPGNPHLIISKGPCLFHAGYILYYQS
jgi:hypothetical protein